MRGRSLQITWQPEDTDETLKMAYRAEPGGTVLTRLHDLWLLRTGLSLRLVLELVGTHYRSVQRLVAWYRQGGLSVVRCHRTRGVGQPSFLTAAAQAEVADVVATGRFRTAAELRDWITEQLSRDLQRRRRIQLAGAPAVQAEGAPPAQPEGRPGAAGVEKGELRDALAAAGVTLSAPFGFADEMRAGRLFWCWLPALTAVDVRSAIRGLQPFGVAAGVDL